MNGQLVSFLKSRNLVYALVCPTLAFFVTLLTAGCGGGGSSGNGGGPPNYDISGQWSVHERIDTASGVCSGNVGETDDYFVDVIQNGGDLTVTVSALPGETFYGTMSGDNIEWTGGFDESGGRNTFTGMNVRITSLTTYAGTVNWRWSGDGRSCTGTTSVDGSRPDPIEPIDNSDDNNISLNNGGDAECQAGCDTIAACFADLSMSQCMAGCAETFATPSCQACFDDTTCDVLMPCIGEYCDAPVNEWNWQE